MMSYQCRPSPPHEHPFASSAPSPRPSSCKSSIAGWQSNVPAGAPPTPPQRSQAEQLPSVPRQAPAPLPLPPRLPSPPPTSASFASLAAPIVPLLALLPPTPTLFTNFSAGQLESFNHPSRPSSAASSYPSPAESHRSPSPSDDWRPSTAGSASSWDSASPSAPTPSESDAGSSASLGAPSKRKSKASHARKVPEGHVKRPRNAFIIYRSHVIENGLAERSSENDQRNISKIAAFMWKALPPPERAPFEQQAEREKEAHRAANPEYRYQPSVRPGQVRRRRRLMPEEGRATTERECELIAERLAAGATAIERDAIRVEAEATTHLAPPPSESSARRSRSRSPSPARSPSGSSGSTRTRKRASKPPPVLDFPPECYPVSAGGPGPRPSVLADLPPASAPGDSPPPHLAAFHTLSQLAAAHAEDHPPPPPSASGALYAQYHIDTTPLFVPPPPLSSASPADLELSNFAWGPPPLGLEVDVPAPTSYPAPPAPSDPSSPSAPPTFAPSAIPSPAELVKAAWERDASVWERGEAPAVDPSLLFDSWPAPAPTAPEHSLDLTLNLAQTEGSVAWMFGADAAGAAPGDEGLELEGYTAALNDAMGWAY